MGNIVQGVKFVTIAAVLGLMPGMASRAAAKPLKVFILAGQSNMQGHVNVSTFDSMADDPKTALILKEMRNADGTPRVCEKIWISSIGCAGDDTTEQKGRLTAGFGASPKEIGPEFTFGLYLEKATDEPILIIKTSWGGKNLHTDFRPPSAGPYVWGDYEIAQSRHRGDDLEKNKAQRIKATGVYYRMMVEHVHKVLADVKRVVPQYDEKQGYELAGFVWFQGFNDLVSDWTYDKGGQPGGYDLYGQLLTQFIRDVRKDLAAPKMPFVIGVMGIGGVKEDTKRDRQKYFRQAQAAPTLLPEFKGNVVAVRTAPYWDDDLEALQERMEGYWPKVDKRVAAEKDTSWENKMKVMAGNFTPQEWKRLQGVSNGGYHYLGAAKVMAPIGKAFAEAVGLAGAARAAEVRRAEMAGYLLVPTNKVPERYNAGFSLYAAAWPLLQQYPGHEFQTGLFGTWMHAQYEGKPPADLYSDIEGGLGWWRDTRFPTQTPKFIMGGVAVNFKEIANGPAHGAGNWEKPRGLYGVAQLSPWLLFPIDGLNVKQGTCGDLFGYGYLPLPLTTAKTTTGGKNVPTGDNCWTLFLNTANFKGPVCFFTPYFWSHSAEVNPEYAGLLLDSRPSAPNKAFQMETQYVPAALSVDDKGQTYARVAPTSFPVGPEGDTVALHRLTSYSKKAMYDGVKAWFEGGPAVSGAVNPEGAFVQTFRAGGGSTWEIYPQNAAKDKKIAMAWSSFATPVTPDPATYGYKWDGQLVRKTDSPDGARVVLPEYFRVDDGGKKKQWVVAKPSEVPAESGLAELRFDRPKEGAPEPYDTPDAPESSFKKPGPVAGPFKAHLGDGSVVTYSWYRFADQPALLNADLTSEQREKMQARVEKIHRAWTKDRDYFAPPTVGKLADLDPAQIVTPPKGLEIGYVPIATRQEQDAARSTQ